MKKQEENMSATEANMELNERLNGDDEREADQSHIHVESNMIPVNISGEDE
ncbi:MULTISPECIES: hypothetical protein [Rossellomorea]|uniref:hypothetical protein n=1 Tax=Rossellomorea TaxID=2837508 RepID=UPI000B04146E|nr:MULTISPECIES: hypothetical protein [Rossellomorea]MCA0150718.1 hypothetical protein [Rossellomorea vietnamensis]UTE77143.1 hypothetical protein M1J35_21940 [Rossellomorea sp. KS-H15a]WGG45077.1 hypothetical protein P8596_20440 [Rossellomorea sp. DA94]